MSYPTIEQNILKDKSINRWVKMQLVATRKRDIREVLRDVELLKRALDERLDRTIKESKTFKTQVDLNSVSI